MRDIKNVRDSDEVEVLQETPSYVEYNELVQKMHILEKRLEIATKALDHCQGFDFVQYALKEMEGVK